jgi:hypothetical protein
VTSVSPNYELSIPFILTGVSARFSRLPTFLSALYMFRLRMTMTNKIRMDLRSWNNTNWQDNDEIHKAIMNHMAFRN